MCWSVCIIMIPITTVIITIIIIIIIIIIIVVVVVIIIIIIGLITLLGIYLLGNLQLSLTAGGIRLSQGKEIHPVP